MRIDTVTVGVIRPLRHAVLRAGMPVGAACFDGDDEAGTLHLAARDGEAVVGCVTVMQRSFDDAPGRQVRGMAVDPAWRAQGVGAALIAKVHELCSGQRLWCNARLPAVGFYQRMGWRCITDVFDVPTAGPHRRMVGPA